MGVTGGSPIGFDIVSGSEIAAMASCVSSNSALSAFFIYGPGLVDHATPCTQRAPQSSVLRASRGRIPYMARFPVWTLACGG